jgi:formate dehydrogenase subunit beta
MWQRCWLNGWNHSVPGWQAALKEGENLTSKWLLKTHGDPLAAVQHFLREVYRTGGLDALLVPVLTGEPVTVEPQIINDPAQITRADPFAPLMTINAARLVADHLQAHPQQRLGAVLRACEIRALREVAGRAQLDLGPVLVVGVDCVGTFSAEDFAWRGSLDQLTREALQFARQGSVAAFRYRPACQTCTEPMPEAIGLTVDLLGLPARQAIVITARDTALAGALSFAEITDGPAPEPLVSQHERMRAALHDRRDRARQRIHEKLATDLSTDVDALVAHLNGCAPCRKCLDVCPIASNDPLLREGKFTHETVTGWLASCAGCGMCEETCPEHLPLAHIFARLRDELAAALEDVEPAV